MIRWPIELIDDIAKRNSVLYLGSGISAASKNDSGKSPATWRKFLEDIACYRNIRKRGEKQHDISKPADFGHRILFRMLKIELIMVFPTGKVLFDWRLMIES